MGIFSYVFMHDNRKLYKELKLAKINNKRQMKKINLSFYGDGAMKTFKQ